MKLEDIIELQKQWEILKHSGKMTKKAMCELCIPFRDKFHLSDMETLCIARNEYSLSKINEIISRGETK